MRAMLTVGVTLAICFTLFGCGESQQKSQAPVAAVAVVPPPCNCQPAQTASVAPPTVHHRSHRHHSWSGNGSYSESSSLDSSSYSEDSSYSESSSSSVREYRPGDEDHYVGAAGTEEHMSQSANPSDGAWVDGYGRAHYRDYGPLDDEHPGLISRKDERQRMRPWRGYDSDCDNRID